MTAQIADAIMGDGELAPKGVMVIISAEHMCMTMRGVKKPGTRTVTIEKRGLFKDDEKICTEVMELLKV